MAANNSQSRPLPRSLRLSIATLGVVAVVAGCGLEAEEAPEPEQLPEPGSAVLSPERIAESAAGTPERAILKWWRAIQVRDPKLVLDSYVPEAREEIEDDIDRWVFTVIGSRFSVADIEITSAEITDDEAVVELTVDSPNPVVTGPLTQRLVEEDGDWLLADAAFLETVVEAIEAQIRASG